MCLFIYIKAILLGTYEFRMGAVLTLFRILLLAIILSFKFTFTTSLDSFMLCLYNTTFPFHLMSLYLRSVFCDQSVTKFI